VEQANKIYWFFWGTGLILLNPPLPSNSSMFSTNNKTKEKKERDVTKQRGMGCGGL
jgi:hypothetical protein